MDKKVVTQEEQRQIQLQMMDEIDAFCKENGIRYSLAFGTLLGAIRHKGFIPWDDDLDIMMPLPDLLKFKATFKSNNIKYQDVDNNRFHKFPFSLLADKQTFSKEGRIMKSNGVSIDLYVVVGLPKEDNIDSFFEILMPLFNRRIDMIGLRSRVMNHLPVRTIPFFNRVQKKCRDYLFYTVPFDSASTFYVVAGPLKMRKHCMYNVDLFNELIQAPFENRMYQITSEYQLFLGKRYGDYMQLPPIEEQKPAHGITYYWK